MPFFPKFFAAAAVAATLAMGASAAMAGPYSVHWSSGSTTHALAINPIVSPNGTGFHTAEQYYSYSNPLGSAANTPDALERSNTATMFLYDDPGNGLSLFHIYDRSNDGSGMRANVSITSAGLAGTGQSFIVRDDPGDSSYLWNDATGSANLSFQSFSCCTDGWVLGLLPDAPSVSWSINAAFSNLEGITNFDIVMLADPYTTPANRHIQRFSIPGSAINTLEFVRTGETVVAVPAPATALFPLAALFLIGGIARRRRQA